MWPTQRGIHRFKVATTWRGDPLSFIQRGLLNDVLRLIIDVHESVEGLLVYLRRWAFVLNVRGPLTRFAVLFESRMTLLPCRLMSPTHDDEITAWFAIENPMAIYWYTVLGDKENLSRSVID